MRRFLAMAAVVLLCLGMCTPAVAQSQSARVGGTVADRAGALIPGVDVKATNDATGIATMVVTNETGNYQFANLQPGVYTVTASLTGFQTQTLKDVELGISQQVRLN